MQGGRILTFPGLPAEAIKFLGALKRHNSREWFQQNKPVYEEFVRRPMEALIQALAEDFRQFAPDIIATPKSSLYRIYRDTRFSKDKTPYKTHVAAVFPTRGLDRHEGAGFYFHFSPEELLIGGGLYMPARDDLLTVREHIAGHYEEMEKISKTHRFRRTFGEIQGERVVRVPRGFPSDHPAAAELRRKQWLAATTAKAETVLTTQFHGMLVDSFKALYPLVQFLNEPILRNRKLRERHDAMFAIS